jgi:amidase
VSAREVTLAHLERISEVNPQINAVVTVTAERALERADLLDRRFAAREELGPLHGLPVAHKDSRLTAGVRTTFGSPIHKDFVPTTDDFVVTRMREAGAVMLGKTNLPEFGAGSHTFNPVFGPTRNPYDLTKSAGGSSGGAAAGLAAGMFALADGSDMGGSLRNPASFCNVVGLRPSPGRVPDAPPWSALSVSGPMARDAGDVALLLSVLAGSDFTASASGGIAEWRVAWSPDLGGSVPVDPAVRSALSGVPSLFSALGCQVTEDCPRFDGADEAFRTLRALQFEESLSTALDRHRDLLKPWLVWNIEQGRALTGSQVARAERLRTDLFTTMERFFERYDVLLLPVSQVAPFDVSLEFPSSVDGVPMETYIDWMRSCYYVSVTACPAMSVPAGFTPDGLPVGLQIVTRYRDEASALRAAAAFEAARPSSLGSLGQVLGAGAGVDLEGADDLLLGVVEHLSPLG